MKTREVLEWLSLAPADIPCWLAGGALAWMWFAGSFLFAVVLAGVAILLSLIACYFGMRQRKDFSHLTNQSKVVLYPLFVIVVIIAVCWILANRTFSN
jgi:hypothetical protein